MYIDYGLNLAEQDAYGYTFFHNAAMTDDVELLDGLSVSPEALNLKTNEDGNTALIFAVFSRSFSIAEKLIELGADPNVKNSEGNTIFDICPDSIKELVSEYRLRGRDFSLGYKLPRCIATRIFSIAKKRYTDLKKK